MMGDIPFEPLTGDGDQCLSAGQGYIQLAINIESSLEALYCMAADPSGAMQSQAGEKAKQVAQQIAADLLAVAYVHRTVGGALTGYSFGLGSAKQVSDDAAAQLVELSAASPGIDSAVVSALGQVGYWQGQVSAAASQSPPNPDSVSVSSYLLGQAQQDYQRFVGIQTAHYEEITHQQNRWWHGDYGGGGKDLKDTSARTATNTIQNVFLDTPPGAPYNPSDLIAPMTVADINAALSAAGLLPASTNELWDDWEANLTAAGIPVSEVVKIVREQHLTPDSFNVLANLGTKKDPDGKTFFVLPVPVDAGTAEQIVLMGYIYNARTDYAKADKSANDKIDTSITADSYPETPYSAAEIARIQQRIAANSASYSDLLQTVQNSGGQVVATPNGMMMGIAMGEQPGDSVGERMAKREILMLSQGGGTTYGDMFIVNIDNSQDPLTTLMNIISNGASPLTSDPTGNTTAKYQGIGPDGQVGTIDLDRILHHEEIHSQQWAATGWKFAPKYLFQSVTGKADEKNTYEQQAGLADGGYEAPR